jgi:DNA-directed RNA polymerase specialized sigma24 family protein
MDINYEKVLKYAKQLAMRFFSDPDTVQEIAQLTAIQFFLNSNRIDPEKADNWIFTVTKNFCIKRIKTQQNSKEMNLDSMLLESYPDTSPEYLEQEIDITGYDFILDKDKLILQSYYLEHLSLSVIARNHKIELKKLKDKIYRLTQEIILFHRMKENFFAPSIPGTKIHNTIYYTVKKLKKAIEENQVEEFINSLHNCKINDCFDCIQIKSIFKISIYFGKRGYYQALIVYKDFADEFKAFLFKFVLTKNNKMKIIEIPIMPILVASCKKNKLPPELAHESKIPLKNGRSRITPALVEQLIENKSLKVTQHKES